MKLFFCHSSSTSSFFSVRPQKLETNWGSNNFTEVCIICRQFSKGQVFEPLPFLTNTITGQCWLLTTVICNEIQSHLCINARRKQNKNKDVTFTALFWTWKCIFICTGFATLKGQNFKTMKCMTYFVGF